MPSGKILVLGASGYVGSRLIAVLLQKGYSVRAAARSLEYLKLKPWASHSRVELFPVDVFDLNSLSKACEGCDVAFYLVHSMNPRQRNFEEADRKAAGNMIKAAELQHLKRIIYLGGLGDKKTKLSPHLRSRLEVSKILHDGKVPATTLRAAMIIGEGSVAFEILNYLANRSPFVVKSRWTQTPSQPIAIRNVLNYLTGCLEHEETKGEIYDIGGPDIVSYQQLLELYLDVASLPKKMFFSIPFLTPAMSGYWVCLTTPVSCSLTRPLAEGMKNILICRDDRIKEIIAQDLLSCREAISRALHLDQNLKGEGSFPPVEWKFPGDPPWVGMARRR